MSAEGKRAPIPGVEGIELTSDKWVGSDVLSSPWNAHVGSE
jgi:hypothetical protein